MYVCDIGSDIQYTSNKHNYNSIQLDVPTPIGVVISGNDYNSGYRYRTNKKNTKTSRY